MRRSLAPQKNVQRFGFSLSLLNICLLELLAVSSPAQNIVSRPVGFVRIDGGALASSPFTALESGETAVLIWDAENQQYALTNTLPTPGQGFAVADTRTMFLAGELDEVERRGTPNGRANSRCPGDAEITGASSADALKQAYRRAAACFARELRAGRRWNEIGEVSTSTR